ncbi:hypothetical protein [Planctomonas psychrotolerans]|uniref:hypothetical protein n=1 Tax=Planctomonas psychrotolerans TaxID=2528712 RepID=UPI001D0D0F65|nr:hypothetical protein [Planctomonas psychrotolerans]
MLPFADAGSYLDSEDLLLVLVEDGDSSCATVGPDKQTDSDARDEPLDDVAM